MNPSPAPGSAAQSSWARLVGLELVVPRIVSLPRIRSSELVCPHEWVRYQPQAADHDATGAADRDANPDPVGDN